MIRNILRWVMALITMILALIGTVGCRSGKDVAANGDNATTVIGDATNPGATKTPQSLDSRYNALVSTWKPWNDMEVGAKLNVTSPVKLNGAGKIYMRRGQWISVSVRMLGFEVANLWLDNDSIVVVDKFHKKYLSEPTSKLIGGADVTIENIQDLLLGRAFLAGGGMATADSRQQFNFSEVENGWYIIPRQQPKEYTYGFLASLTANALRGAAVDVDNFGAVTAEYSDYFESRNCGWFAQTVSVANTRGKKIAATLRLDLNGARFNTGVAKQCNLPKGYERIPASSLASLLKSF